MNEEIIDIAQSLHTNSLLSQMDSYLAIKDTQSRFITGNQRCAHLLGYRDTDAMYLSTDSEMNVKASEYADGFVASDRRVMQSKTSMKVINIYQYAYDETHILFSCKHPAFSKINGEVIGTFAEAKDLSSSVLSILDSSLINLLKKKETQQTIEICKSPAQSLLTEKESMILFFLLHGYSCKYIANILHKSFRTIEYHVENIKNKFGCNTRDQIIEISHKNRYGNTMPESLFKTLMAR